MPSDLDRAYMAGLIDGEGSIQIVILNKSKHYFQTRIAIAMANPEAIEWAHKVFGGRFYRHRNNYNVKTAKDLYRVDWTGSTVMPLIREVYPFLKVKQPQAECLMAFTALAESQKSENRRYAALKKHGRPVDEAARQERIKVLLELRNRCSELNHTV